MKKQTLIVPHTTSRVRPFVYWWDGVECCIVQAECLQELAYQKAYAVSSNVIFQGGIILRLRVMTEN